MLRNALYSLLALVLLLLPSLVFADEVLQFTPLTGLPGLNQTAGIDSLSGFLNMVYRICVGAAAVLAVIQFTRAGMVYMLQDSITERKEARHLMLMSVLGLLLVLSPTVVFSMIDSRILDLELDASGLQLGELSDIDSSISGNQREIRNGTELRSQEDIARCTAMESCRVQQVQQGNETIAECYCSQVETGNEDGTRTGLVHQTETFNFESGEFVFMATTLRSASDHGAGTENLRCAMVWGGAFDSAAACQQNRASVTNSHSDETAFQVRHNCVHITNEYQLEGACVQGNRGSFPRLR